MLLVFSSVYATLVPSANAAEVTNKQKGLSILSNVVGLNLTKYAVTAEDIQVGPQASYLDVVLQEKVAYELTSDSNKIKALYTFANGKLQMIQVLEREGSPSFVKSAAISNDVELAKDFLSNYQRYTGNSLFGELNSMLDGGFFGENFTKASGNIVLESTGNEGETSFKWYYSENGAVAPYSKFVTLCFKNGFLSAFVDNWRLYNVGSTTVRLSEKEAVAIALETAKAHSWSLKLEDAALDAENFNESNVRWTSLIFDNSLDGGKARSEDLLELYPVWRVGVALDKWYGQMYGIQVDVWADTGEVRCVQEAWSTLPPPEGVPTAYGGGQVDDVSEAKPSLAMEVAFPAFALAAAAAFVWFGRRKKARYFSLPSPRVVKAGGMLLCMLIASMTLFATITTVNATSRVGVVWGSESTGAYNFGLPDHNWTWRKHQPELYWQKNTAGNISQWFSANGYTGINHQGNLGSSRSQILTDMGVTISGYDYAAVVDFDHGIGGFPGQIQGYPVPGVPQGEFHYMLEDNIGTVTGPYNGTHTTEPMNAIYDMDVYLTLPTGKLKFAFINTCLSACIDDYVGANYAKQRIIQGNPPYSYTRPVGMPLGWTRRNVSDIDSTDGFNIEYDISIDGYGDPDMGSQVYIGFPYGSASLEQNIPSVQGPTQYYEWVYEFFQSALYDGVSVNDALDSASLELLGWHFDTSPLQTGFTAYWWDPDDPMTQSDCTMAVYGNGNIHLKNYVPPSHSVAVRSFAGPSSGDVDVSYQFSASAACSEGHDVRYLFDWGDGTENVTGYYDSYDTVSVSHSWSEEEQYSVKVKAQCEGGLWSDWSNTRTMKIGQRLTVLAYNQYEQEGHPPVYLDGDYLGTAGHTFTVTTGNHEIGMYTPIYEYYEGHIWLHTFCWYYYDGVYNASNPITLSITDDKTVTAYYYSEIWA
jgi:hypothetical protein